MTHPGNKWFRSIIDEKLSTYSSAKSKLEKSVVVSSIVDTIRAKSPNGSFVKHDTSTGTWYEVSDRLAREKVGQSLRDALHSQYKSSTTAKKKRRRAEQEKQAEEMDLIIERNPEVSAVITRLNRQITEQIPDHRVGKLFDEANSKILTELKRAQSAASYFSTKKAPATQEEANKSLKTLKDQIPGKLEHIYET
eukprot:CAMPEP_0194049290 /NCGR_PEP_ID=MMETSP0009_2-20130614/30234_1 /TAXON_ID=210454 /ORGANISM="Grammatophora oceanica, Strain CCMP 410" /LENGTH=193 /DNA_ID=CAMNT_0038695403 /DNA_START=238 /DNA_END=819 /DNA_ORIENTATION=+